MADNILQLPEYDGMKIYPVEIINELVRMNRASMHILIDATLESEDEDVSEPAQQALDEQEQYLLDKGLSQDDCDTLIEVVKKYNLLDFNLSKSTGKAVLLFIACCVATAFLAYLNYYLYTEKNRIWFLSIAANVVTLLGIPFSLLYAIISAPDILRVKREKYSKCRDVARIDEIKRFANYLVSHHNYDAEALSFYLCQYLLDDVDIVIILKQLGLSLTEEKRKE